MTTIRPHIVIGGGIAGVECVLTLRATLPHASVILITDRPFLRIRPNLVYVALGRRDVAHEIMLDRSQLDGATVLRDIAVHIDRVSQTVTCASGRMLMYESLILAPGTVPRPSSGFRLRTIDDAHALSRRLADVATHPRPLHGVLIRDLPDDTWNPPAYEMAFLIDGWLRARRVRDRVRLSLATPDHVMFETFGPHVSDTVARELERRAIGCLVGVPPGRIEDLDDDLVIDAGGFTAARCAGEPPPSGDGFFRTGKNGRIASHIYVVGDAADLPYKGGFTCSWQARRVAHALGGNLTLLGTHVDGVAVDSFEYQMDLAGSVLRVQMSIAGVTSMLGAPRTLQHKIVPGSPTKLKGTLLRSRLLANHDLESVSERIQYDAPIG